MPQLKPRQSKSNPRQWFSSCSSSESPSSTLEKKREKARRTLSRDDPSYLEFLRSSEEQQRDRDLRRRGEPLAGIVKEKFETVLKHQAALPSDGQVFPPVPPLQPTQGSSSGHWVALWHHQYFWWVRVPEWAQFLATFLHQLRTSPCSVCVRAFLRCIRYGRSTEVQGAWDACFTWAPCWLVLCGFLVYFQRTIGFGEAIPTETCPWPRPPTHVTAAWFRVGRHVVGFQLHIHKSVTSHWCFN